MNSEQVVEEATAQGKKSGVVEGLGYECMFKLEEVLTGRHLRCVKLVT